MIAHSDWPASHRREGQSFDPHPLRPEAFFFLCWLFGTNKEKGWQKKIPKKWYPKKRMKKVSQKHRLISLHQLTSWTTKNHSTEIHRRLRLSSFVPDPTTSRPCAIVWLSLEQRLPTIMDRYLVAKLIDMICYVFLRKWIKTGLGFLLIESAFAPTVSAVSTLDLDGQSLSKTSHQLHKNVHDYIRLITCHHQNGCQ